MPVWCCAVPFTVVREIHHPSANGKHPDNDQSRNPMDTASDQVIVLAV
ncbi:Uncharacterised protein [Vibrio cholerae]|uniref:Uncharacterized protein n=1 Tax=Vibrio cholerae TaxID=666 RepID=A0A655RMH2_VIBCL|nr:Uncharacterised protein [Vibrio cholerae]CSD08414.1 Uncharacterised protein [Vibrio cholerae]